MTEKKLNIQEFLDQDQKKDLLLHYRMYIIHPDCCNWVLNLPRPESIV